MKLDIPFKTYFQLFFVCLVVYFLFELRYQILLLFLALIVAMALYSAEKFLAQKGLTRKYSMPLLISLYLSVIFSIVLFVIPTVVNQLMDLTQNFNEMKIKISQVPHFNVIEKQIKEFFTDSPEIISGLKETLAFISRLTLTGLLDIGIFFIVSIYMYTDGNRSYNYLRSHFSEENRKKIDMTIREIDPIMTAYVFGQAMTSTFAALVVYVSAKILKIPAAMTLALLAAIFDVLPGIGLIFLIIVASILSLAVSVKTTITIVIILVGYHLCESYLLTPYIYGQRMKISPLVVLISIILAGSIAGVQGMIAVLPIVAAYPTFERIWLKDLLKAL